MVDSFRNFARFKIFLSCNQIRPPDKVLILLAISPAKAGLSIKTIQALSGL